MKASPSCIASLGTAKYINFFCATPSRLASVLLLTGMVAKQQLPSSPSVSTGVYVV
jgi:hypothetical protein